MDSLKTEYNPPDNLKEPFDPRLDLDARTQIGVRIAQMIDVSRSQVNQMEGRDERNEGFYQCRPEPKGADALAHPNATNVHVPLTTQRIDSVQDAVVSPISESKPYFYCKLQGPSQTRQEPIENDLHFLLEQGGFIDAVERGLNLTLVNGLVGVRVSNRVDIGAGYGRRRVSHADLDAQAMGVVVSGVTYAMTQVGYAGLALEVVHRRALVAYPLDRVDPHEMVLIAVESFMTLREIVEKQIAGDWFSDKRISPSGRVAQPGVDTTHNKTGGPTQNLTAWDTPDRLFEGIVEWALPGDVVAKPYSFVLAHSSSTLLSFEPYELPVCNIACGRVHYEHGVFQPASSLAQLMQGNQIIHNESFNLAIEGGWASVFPSGFSEGAMDSNVFQYGYGRIFSGPGYSKIAWAPVGVRLDPLPMLIQSIQRTTDEVGGTSPSDISAPVLGGSGTLGETQIISQRADLRKAGYRRRFAATCLVPLAEAALEIYKANFDLYKAYWGNQLQCIREDLDLPVRVELASQAAEASSPGYILQMTNAVVSLAGQLAQIDPTIKNRVRWDVLLEGTAAASQLSNSDRLLRPVQEARVLDAIDMASQQLQMIIENVPIPEIQQLAMQVLQTLEMARPQAVESEIAKQDVAGNQGPGGINPLGPGGPPILEEGAVADVGGGEVDALAGYG